jgi:PilZ domain
MPTHSRQHPRVEGTLRVDYVDAQGHGGLGLAKNLSYTGLYLTCVSRPLHVGETLTLTFVTPTGKACKLHACVVHTNKAGAGLRFTDAQAAYRQLGGQID